MSLCHDELATENVEETSLECWTNLTPPGPEDVHRTAASNMATTVILEYTLSHLIKNPSLPPTNLLNDLLAD